MSGVNNVSGEGQGKNIIMLSLPNKKVSPFTKKKVEPSEKVTPSEEVKKVSIF